MLVQAMTTWRTHGLKDSLGSDSLRLLYDYWQAHGGPGLGLAADAINPSDIGPCLSYTIILDVIGSPRRFRYRFCGTSVDGVNGQYRTGRFLDEIDLGAQTERTVGMMHKVAETRQPSHFTGDFVARDGRSLRYERIAMPLSSDGRAVDAILVGLQYLLIVEAVPEARYEYLPTYLDR